jgi:hypothetical protein
MVREVYVLAFNGCTQAYEGSVRVMVRQCNLNLHSPFIIHEKYCVYLSMCNFAENTCYYYFNRFI